MSPSLSPSTPIAVSVVVPVYNAGEYLQRCLDSLLQQEMPAGTVELIFVDDGSSDDSLERLHALEREHEALRVIAIPHSGWPGRPRNVGADGASGEYVMFVDQDDVLDPEALQRMYALGSANDADVVLGKVISDFRGVHHYLYRENRARCTVDDARLMNSQTPHKMLRREFLREHKLRFPEGQRRLEDQLFITSAYFAASSVSIVADYVCYRYLRRADFRNAGSHRIDPVHYYENLREVLDVVAAHTEPGERRDRFYRRFFKTEMLSRLGGRKLFNAPADHRPMLLAEIRRLMEERFEPEVADGLPALLRARAALVRDGTLDDLLSQARRTGKLGLVITLTGIGPAAADGVELGVEAEFSYDGEPLLLERSGDCWLLPRSLVGPAVTDVERMLEPVTATVGDVVVRHREQLDEWFLPSRLEPAIQETDAGGRLRWRGVAVLNPDVAAGGAALRRGVHDLLVRVDAFGINRTARLGARRAPMIGVESLVILGERRNMLYANRSGNLSIKAGLSRAAAHNLIAREARARAVGGRLEVTLPLAWHEPPAPIRATLNHPRTGTSQRVNLRPAEGGEGGWCSKESALTGLNGRFEVRLKLAGLGQVDLVTPLKVTQPAPPRANGTLVQRGIRVAGRTLPEPLVKRLRQNTTLRRLTGRPPR
ncbi:MAG TPA: glycosyltransferase family A protein [Microlunatus sp.]